MRSSRGDAAAPGDGGAAHDARDAGPDRVAALVGRERALVGGGVGALAVLAWLYLLHLARDGGMGGHGMGGDAMGAIAPLVRPWGGADALAAFAMWTVMMAAMMLPSAAPVILLYAALNRKRRSRDGLGVPTGVFVLGYLVVWTAFSAGAVLLQWALQAAAVLSPSAALESPWLAGGLLVAAGAYQLSPLKRRCLGHCRSPLGFLVTAWRDGAGGALRMGLRHGAYCLGCCWMLMSLLFVLGVMNLLWVAALAGFVLLEKLAPGGVLIGRVTALALIGSGCVVLGRALLALAAA
jgi:predicted metal-binding membrane protein